MKTQQFIFNKDKSFRIYALMLCAFLWIYLLLRAWFNEPLHDEVAAFFNYIETGKILGQGVVQDAQNHLLYSFSQHFLHRCFGDHFFVFRIPSLLAFLLFFAGIYRLSYLIPHFFYRTLFLTAMTTIAFIDEYFAYSRGYSLGMAFYTWLLIWLNQWIKEPSLKTAFLVYFFAYFALFSNLVFFGSIALMAVVMLAVQFKNRKTISRNLHFLFLGMALAFGLSLVPFLWLSYVLKMGGGFYYGSLEGLWDVTGKSLSINTLFYDGELLKWIFILLFAGVIFLLIRRIIKRGFWKQLKEMESLAAYLFFGNLLVVLVLAHVLKVNYPEDRIGMYFIFLFLLMLFLLINSLPRLRFLLLLFLFFPISFLFKMNLHTSIFSPDNRMTNSFYQKVRPLIGKDDTFVLHPLQMLTWCYHERSQKGTKIIPVDEREFDPSYDFFITKTHYLKSSDDISGFERVAFEKESSLVAYKRKKNFPSIVLAQIEVNASASDRKWSLLTYKNTAANPKKLQVKIAGNIRIEGPLDKAIIQLGLVSKNDTTWTRIGPFRWVASFDLVDYPFQLNFMVKEKLKPGEKLLVKFSNPEGRLTTFKSAKLKIIEINPDYGTR